MNRYLMVEFGAVYLPPCYFGVRSSGSSTGSYPVCAGSIPAPDTKGTPGLIPGVDVAEHCCDGGKASVWP